MTFRVTPRPKRRKLSAIFWDYENVQLNRTTCPIFLQALRNFMDLNPTQFAAVYYRTISCRPEILRQIQAIPGLQTKRVDNDAHNAVDSVLMQSCRDAINRHSTINHIVLISGDADYRQLISHLTNKRISVSIICRQGHYSRKLLRAGDLFRFHQADRKSVV